MFNKLFKVFICLNKCVIVELNFTGLPHTQGIQGNSGNFQVEENLREF